MYALIAARIAAEMEMTRADLLNIDDRTTLLSLPGEGDLSTTVIVGNGANALQYAEQLGPHLTELGPAHFVVYPKQRFSLDSIGENLIEASDRSGGRRKAVIFFSMGQMVFNHLMARPEIAEGVGDLDYAIGDSGVTRIANLKAGTSFLLNVGGRIPDLHTFARVYDLVIGQDNSKLYEDSSQWRWMLHAEELRPGQLADVGANIGVKKLIYSPNDYRVKHLDSHTDQNILWGGGWDLEINRKRKSKSHTEGLSRPEDLVTILKRPLVGQ